MAYSIEFQMLSKDPASKIKAQMSKISVMRLTLVTYTKNIVD